MAMQIKQKLTEVVLDNVTEYLQETFNKLRQFDLDADGHKDIDQVIEILARCGARAKETLSSTDASGIAAGLQQIVAGVTLIQKSFDQETVTALLNELTTASTKITELAQLSITYVKEHGRHG
jgi:Ca2+-binding EF-hand superfamily protein